MRNLFFRWLSLSMLGISQDLALWGMRAWLNPPGGAFGATLASTTTLAPVAPVSYVSGTSAITTITAPFTGFLGVLTLIATGAWTTTTSGNIARIITAASGQAIQFAYDGSSWYPAN